MAKVYFAGSIRGGRSDAELYKHLIEHIQRTDVVLTEHIGNLELSALEKERDADRQIYLQDTAWLRECDLVIAECTNTSLGVGYELAYAERHSKPIHILYRKKDCSLSAMLTGNPYNAIYPYENENEAKAIISKILEQN